MKLTIDQSPLSDALGWLATVLPKRPEQPILAGVRLRADEHGLTAQAYNLETSHTAQLGAQIGEPGQAIVSGFLLRGLVSTLSASEPVVLSSDDSELTMIQGRSRYRLGLMPAGDFPALPVMPPTVGTIGLEPLAGMVTSAAHPIEIDSAFEDLRGLRIEAEGSHLTIVGARRQMIAVRDAAWPFDPINALAPLSTIEGALRGFGLGGEAAVITIGLTDGLLGLSGPGAGGTRAVTTRLYALDKPLVWQRLIRAREADEAQAIVPGGELVRALRRAAFLAGEEAAATLTYDPNGWLGIHVIGHANYGDGHDLLDAETEGGEELVLGVNPGWLADAVAALVPDDGPVRLGFAGPRRPITIRPAAASPDDRAVTVLMPRDLSRGISA